MPGLELPPSNPAELASETAANMYKEPDPFEHDSDAYVSLFKLEEEAAALKFTDSQYFVETSRGLSIPATPQLSEDNKYSYKSFHKLTFEGIFRGYSKVAIGRIIGGDSVRAYCLTFDEVLLLPFFDSLSEDHIFHVPALAVDSIDRTS